MKKKQVKIKYPWVSVDTTQAEGSYEVYLALTENLHLSAYLDEQGLTSLEQSIKSIREHQKRLSSVRGKGEGEK